MEPEELLAHARDVCDRLGLTYLVVGSTATIAYGEPRFTNDIDIVIDLPATQLDEFCAGFPATDFYISQSAASDAIRRKAQFNVIHPVSGLKIDFIVLSDSPFDLSRRGRRRDLPVLEEGPTWFASPEDVVLKKLVYFKEGGSDNTSATLQVCSRCKLRSLTASTLRNGRWTWKFRTCGNWSLEITRQSRPRTFGSDQTSHRGFLRKEAVPASQ